MGESRTCSTCPQEALVAAPYGGLELCLGCLRRLNSFLENSTQAWRDEHQGIALLPFIKGDDFGMAPDGTVVAIDRDWAFLNRRITERIEYIERRISSAKTAKLRAKLERQRRLALDVYKTLSKLLEFEAEAQAKAEK